MRQCFEVCAGVMRSEDRARFGQERITPIGCGRIAERGFTPGRLRAGRFNCQAEVFGSLDDFGKQNISAVPIALDGQPLCVRPLRLHQQQRAPMFASNGQGGFKMRPGF